MQGIDSVGWPRPRLNALVRRMDEDARYRLMSETRRMRGARGLLTVCQSGSETRYLAPVTQFGSTMMSFLIRLMLHPGTLCVVHLRTPEGERFDISGKTSSCRHVEGVVHEIDLEFDAPIDLRTFVGGGDEPTSDLGAA